MEQRKGGPALWLALTRMHVVVLAAVLGLAACGDEPTTEACSDGDPWCASYTAPGTGGSGGTGNTGGTGGNAGSGGGGYTCLDDPNYGLACTLPNGQPGVWDCTADNTDLVCVDIHGGTGGAGGTAGTEIGRAHV